MEATAAAQAAIAGAIEGNDAKMAEVAGVKQTAAAAVTDAAAKAGQVAGAQAKRAEKLKQQAEKLAEIKQQSEIAAASLKAQKQVSLIDSFC